MKELLNIEVDNHHRAYYDALTTAIIFDKSLENIKKSNNSKIKTVEALITFSKSDNIINNNQKRS